MSHTGWSSWNVPLDGPDICFAAQSTSARQSAQPHQCRSHRYGSSSGACSAPAKKCKWDHAQRDDPQTRSRPGETLLRWKNIGMTCCIQWNNKIYIPPLRPSYTTENHYECMSCMKVAVPDFDAFDQRMYCVHCAMTSHLQFMCRLAHTIAVQMPIVDATTTVLVCTPKPCFSAPERRSLVVQVNPTGQ